MRRIVPTFAFVVGLVALAGCLPPPPPPQNGQLPDSSLTTVTASCRVASDVADPLQQLMYFSLITGTYVQPETQAYVAPLPGPPRNESCYRTLEMQQWWRNFYCFFSSCDFAAVPGTSVHGWGRAVDFEDAGGELTFGSAGYAWLQANAWRFGFVHPAWAEPGGSSPEPWHWEHS